MIFLKKNIEKGKRLMHIDYSSYNHTILPPVNTRLMGEKFKEDRYYYESSLFEGERLKHKLGVNKDTRLLEIGCTTGRMVNGLIKKIGKIRQYDGVDIKINNIRWCNYYIARKYGFCKFHHINIRHVLYNKSGNIELNDYFRYPFTDSSYDVIYLHSIVANQLEAETNVLSKEFYRLADKGGRVFFTAFIEENVPSVTENPKDYVMECKYPVQIVRYEKNFILKIFTDSGFIVDHFEYGNETDHQSGVYLSKPLH